MRRPQTALVLVGVLALVGGGTALASKGTSGSSSTTTTTTTTPTHPFRGDGGPHGPSDDLQAAASYLGTTTSNLLTELQAGKTLAQIASATSGTSTAGLIAALVAAEKTEIADAVKANTLTQAQADAITANLQQRFTDFVNGVHPDHGPGGPGGPHGFGGPGPLDAAATYLGIGRPALATQLQAGKTLAQIANATSGKSASGLIAALVADAKQRFGSNVPSDLEQDITDLVNGVRPAFGPGGGHHDHGPFGPPPSGGSSA
jgi:hypothetical protein